MTTLRLWVDDERNPVDFLDDASAWRWVKTSQEALGVLAEVVASGVVFEAVSFDHDLGGQDTTRPVVLWMIEHEVFPARARVHTMNPVGREWLVGMIARYFPHPVG